jgi:dienelactone hydrolase
MILTLLFSLIANAQELPSAPLNVEHPGSKIYAYGVQENKVKCQGRDIVVYSPTPAKISSYPVVIYGHGQALDVEHYEQTLRHLAGKGVIAVHPQYDTGFFDRNWTRMARDFVNLTSCAMKELKLNVNPEAVVFTGHSKGAYVAGVAAGLAEKENLSLKAGAVLLFQPAGIDPVIWRELNPQTKVTVIHADQDTIVKPEIAEQLYREALVEYKQYIVLQSYKSSNGQEQLGAKHFWPLTKKSAFGGGTESAFHYYGSWKWLTAAVWDLNDGSRAENTYLYGVDATDKGRENSTDSIERNWQ